MNRFIRALFLITLVQYTFGYACSEAQKADIATGKSCGNFDASDKKICVLNPDRDMLPDSPACMEVSCSDVPKSIQIACSDFKVDVGKLCLDAGENEATKCKEVEISCIEAQGDLTEDKCKNLFVSLEKRNYYFCSFNSETSKCEEKLKSCNDVTELGEKSCSDFPTSNPAETVCIENNANENSKCKEEILCEKASGNSNEDCNKYPVEYSKKGTHICMFNPNENKCFEQYFCESVINVDVSKINCESFPVKIENTNSHICVKDTSGEKLCKEQEISPPTTLPLKETEKSLPEAISLASLRLDEKTNPLTNEVPTTTKTEAVPLSTIALKTTIPNIATTENEIIVPTTITNKKVPLTTIIEEKKEEETSVVFLGCGKLVMKTASFTFIIYFVLVKNSIYAKNIIIKIVIIYNSHLRRLENHEAVCTLDETNTNSIIGYKCNVQAPTANIRQIKLEDNFNFGSDNNMKLVGITPIAKLFMENLQEANDNYGNLLSSGNTVYILDNSTLYQNETSHFGIYGILNGEKPKTITKNKNLTLMANIEFESENKTKEINCTVTDIKNDNYTLTCEATENLKYYFQSALSVIDDGLLLINFDTYKSENNSILDTENDREISNFRFNYNKSKGLNGGTIVAIILPCIVVLAAVIGIIYYLKKAPKRTDHTESSADNINNFKY